MTNCVCGLRGARKLAFRWIALLLFTFASGLPLALSAQSAETGSVEGRVLNQLTGRYLNNAQVEVVGTDIRAQTNEFGEFRIPGVPAGEQTIRVFYTGLDAYSRSVTVEAGGRTNLSIRLTDRSRLEDADADEDTFELDELRVDGGRVDGSSIAINEQRFAGNIQNVVSSDEFGDVTEGNIGEFIKYLPGVSVEYVAADIRAISVRGLGDSQTVVTFDGNSMASAASGSATRRFELEQVSINNVARVELVKVPTPDMRADTLGGRVNMVSKSAFELVEPQFAYRAYFSMNSESLDWGPTPGPQTNESRKIRPGFDFSYLNPVNENFGFVLNGLYSNQFNEQHRSLKAWRSDDGLPEMIEDPAAPGSGTMIPNPDKNRSLNAANPYLQDYTFQDGPKETRRESLGTNIDWRPAPDWVVSTGLQWNRYDSFFGNRNLRWRIDRSSPYAPVSYTPTSVQGPEGAGELVHGNAFRDKHGRTYYGNVDVKYFGDTVSFDAGVFFSDGTGKYDDVDRGHFERVQARARDVTVSFDDITDLRPGTITTIAEDGSNFDHTDLSNYEILDARSRPVRSTDRFYGGDFNVEKEFDGAQSYKLKTGVSYRSQVREIFDPTYQWTFTGINGNTSADLIRDPYYSNEDPHFGLEPVEWPSPYLAYELFLSNPEAFTPSAGNATTEANRDIEVEETVTAGYLMGETRFVDNRLRVIGGVRWESTDFDGEGPLNDGDTLIRRGATATGSYQDFFPSIHFTYDVTDHLLVRLAYARTISRPNWNYLIPRNLIDYDSDPDTGGVDQNAGTLEAINGELEPWFGDNIDLSLEYYTESGGLFSAGIFYKKLQDMFETYSDQMTEQIRSDLGLGDDPRFADVTNWTVETTINGGDAEIVGFEFDARQQLDFIGGWGEYFSLFANATLLDLRGDRNTDFSSFVEKTANWGVTFDRGPLEVMLKWNYRGEQQLGPRSNEFAGGFRWYDERLYMDVNVEYIFRPEFGLFLNVRNITNEPQIRLNYNELTPGYARHEQQEEYGIQIALGVKGSF